MKILYLGCDFATYSSVSHECRVARYMAERLGHDVHLVVNRAPGWETPLPANMQQTVLPIDQWLQEGKYDWLPKELDDCDVAFASSASGAPFLAAWKKRTGKKVAAQVLDLPLWRLAWGDRAPWKAQWAPWYKALRGMDRLVFNTVQTSHDFDEAAGIYGYNPGTGPPFNVVYYGIDTAMCDQAKPMAFEHLGDKPVAVGCSRLVPYKGYEHAISALSLIPESLRPNYVIIGDGEDAPRLMQLGQHCGVYPLFAGGVSDEQKFGIIKAATFGLYLAYNRNIPSQFPLEAVYAGKPCIVADIQINRERFSGTKWVRYVNPFNTLDVAEAIPDVGAQILDIDGETNEDARRWIREHRSFESHAQQVAGILVRMTQ